MLQTFCRQDFDVDPESIPISKCPVEHGVVKTKWGSVSVGHVIAGIASALEETTVLFQSLIEEVEVKENGSRRFSQSDRVNTEINNVIVSTLAGSLGQVILHQAFRNPALDNAGKWNDTSYPRAYYIAEKPREMTRATLLGGIDGKNLSLITPSCFPV